MPCSSRWCAEREHPQPFRLLWHEQWPRVPSAPAASGAPLRVVCREGGGRDGGPRRQTAAGPERLLGAQQRYLLQRHLFLEILFVKGGPSWKNGVVTVQGTWNRPGAGWLCKGPLGKLRRLLLPPKAPPGSARFSTSTRTELPARARPGGRRPSPARWRPPPSTSTCRSSGTSRIRFSNLGGLHLSTNHVEILRDISCSRRFVFLFLRIGAP